MKKLAVFWLSIAAVLVAGCVGTTVRGSGRVVTESRPVSGFDAVALSGTGVLTISVGEEEALTVTADDNILEHIETTVDDGRLTIGQKRGMERLDLRPTDPIKYDLTVVQLGAIAVAGSASVVAQTLESEGFNVALSGASDVDIERLETQHLSVAISGSGTVALGGRADVQTVAVTGSGRYEGGTLVSRRASCGVSGSGEATVWVEEELEAGISGSGMVSYYGDPVVRQDVSGSGRVRGLGPRKLTL